MTNEQVDQALKLRGEIHEHTKALSRMKQVRESSDDMLKLNHLLTWPTYFSQTSRILDELLDKEMEVCKELIEIKKKEFEAL